MATESDILLVLLKAELTPFFLLSPSLTPSIGLSNLSTPICPTYFESP